MAVALDVSVRRDGLLLQPRPPALNAEGLVKRYGRHVAVDGISLHVAHGEVFGFLGPNGAGKTTTIGMLLGLLTPTAGTVHLFGQPLAGHEAALLPRVGSLVETPTFYPFMGARDNLRAVGMATGGVSRSQVEETLALVRLSDVADRPYRTYSLGMKQRLGIGAALLTDPDLIILDEPTNGLDPAGIVEIRQLLRQLAEMGKAVCLSSHQLNEVQQICDRVAIVHRGRIVAEGRVADLLAPRRAIRLTVSDLSGALGVLRAEPWTTHIEVLDGAVMVKGEPPGPFSVSETLARHGIWLGTMTREAGSLEQLFLHLTAQDENSSTDDGNHGHS